jgi:hypothetical protein
MSYVYTGYVPLPLNVRFLLIKQTLFYAITDRSAISYSFQLLILIPTFVVYVYKQNKTVQRFHKIEV